ncbi:MAG: hypothetical protein ACKOXO_03140 [Cyanobium sp.]
MSTAEPPTPSSSARSGEDPTATTGDIPFSTATGFKPDATPAGPGEAPPRETSGGGASRGSARSPEQPAPPAGPLERIGELLDRLLVFDVFLVIGAALWFGVAVLLQARGVQAPLRLFQALWQPMFTPAIGLLMAAALLSGALGWWRRRGQR